MIDIMTPIFAILTPFDAKNKIDFHALTDYLQFLQEKGVDTILVNGTTAEFPSLSLEERMALLEHCRQVFRGKVLNNISSCSLVECLQLAHHAGDYADALVLLPPYYYAKVAVQGLFTFFNRVLVECKLPIYLYNFPKHTQNAITPALVQDLLQNHKHLLGIKDSEANLELADRFKALNGGNFQVFIGSDRVVLEVLTRGLDGSVTGGGNALPEFLLTITREFRRGNLVAAERIQQSFNRWNQFRKENPLGEIAITKVALQIRLQHFPIRVRAPLVMAGESEVRDIERVVRDDMLPFIYSI
jgi:4-hydroxy-tetrahydrodipicolinate synthase